MIKCLEKPFIQHEGFDMKESVKEVIQSIEKIEEHYNSGKNVPPEFLLKSLSELKEKLQGLDKFVNICDYEVKENDSLDASISISAYKWYAGPMHTCNHEDSKAF